MKRTSPSVTDCKIQASHLLKDLQRVEPTEALRAAERFCDGGPFAELSPAKLLERREKIQRKHALEAVAREKGFGSWKALKDAADVEWYPRGSPFLNAWFSTHEEARECLDRDGGYLLTYRGKPFVCDRDYVEWLGLDPDDQRWEAIGFDCMKPKNARAHEELLELARKLATPTPG